MMRFRRIMSTLIILLLSYSVIGCGGPTQEKYDKIKTGMTFKEVEKVLGSSPTCDSAAGMKNCTWGNDEKHIKVKFVADRVALHSAKGLK